jgi:hypothetical protein
MGANVKLANAMSTTAKTMTDMNRIMKPEQVAADMRAFGQASMKMDMTDEMSKYTFKLLYCTVILIGVMLSVLPIGHKVCRFKPGRGKRFLREMKIHSTPSFGGEVKPLVPCCKIFVAC